VVLSRPPVIIDPFPRPPELALLGRRVRMEHHRARPLRQRAAPLPRPADRLTRPPDVSTVEDRTAKARPKLPRKLRRAVLRRPRRGVLVRVRASGRDLNGLADRASRRIRVLPPRRP
jgi:hypothetical protein